MRRLARGQEERVPKGSTVNEGKGPLNPSREKKEKQVLQKEDGSLEQSKKSKTMCWPSSCVTPGNALNHNRSEKCTGARIDGVTTHNTTCTVV